MIHVRAAAMAASLALAAAGLLTASAASAPSARTVSGSHPQTAAQRHSITAGSPVCQNITALDHLTVRRTVPAPVGRTTRFAFPSTVRISAVATVRRLTRGLCGLPAPPPGLFCPADFGIRYTLVFAAGPVELRPVTVAPAGCEPVTGLGRIRWLARTASWWATLGDAMKIPVPGQDAFRGVPRTGS